MELKHQYSGKQSQPFWNKVNALKKNADHQELYALGCALQNLEGFVLTQLENAKTGSVEQQEFTTSDRVITTN